MIPFIDLHPVVGLVRDQVLPHWAGALDRCELVGGKPVTALEAALVDQLGVGRAVACANGTDALLLALQAAGVRPGDHVALPNLTFWATFEAVAQLGAIPVLIDIDPDDLQMDFAEFGAAFERYRFKHALLVHLYGWASAHTKQFRKFCRERAITLVEDGAQCYGVTLDGEPVLRGAELATLSFYPAKVIGGCMDGGAVLASTAEQESRLRSLANHGRSSHYSYDHVGWNSRMGAVAAYYLTEVLRHTDQILADRRAAAGRYHAAAAGWTRAKLHRPPAGVVENGYLAVVDTGALGAEPAQRQLTEHKIGTGRVYPETMDQQRPAAGRFVALSELARSRAFVDRVLSLPLYYGITAAQQATVTAATHALFA
jgi:UDP-2-acetamido-2-deoxy-ribo-hexuluronate aminotransferase